MRALARKLERLEYFQQYEVIRFRDLEYVVGVLLHCVHECATAEQAANVDREVQIIMSKARTGELFAPQEQPQ